MTLHVLHRGDGYSYLSKSVAVGDIDDRPDFSQFYDLNGTPPGEWFGRGATAMGVSGQVSEAQMRALFGAGMHPNADQLINAAIADGTPPADALAAGQIGSPLYTLRASKTPVGRLHQQLLTEFVDHNLRAPTRQEWSRMQAEAARQFLTDAAGVVPTEQQIQKSLAAEGRRKRKPVSGYDCVFTAPKSAAGVLFGLGSPAVRQIVWQAHMESVHETLSYGEQAFALAKRGRDGVRTIDTAGWTVALYTHYDNRCGDPNLHTHAVISTKVLGVDGRWSCMDARALHAAASMLSCRYNATIMGKLSRRLGVRVEERSRGRGKKPVLEIACIPQELNDEFSRRRTEIQTVTEQLVAEYTRRHGRSPSKNVQIRLAEKATLVTRGGKPLPRTLTEMLAEWDLRATTWLASIGDDRSGKQFVANLLEEPAGSERPHQFHARSAALAAGVTAGYHAVCARDRTVLQAAVDNELQGYHFATATQRGRAGEQMLQLLDPDNHVGVVAQVRDHEIAEARVRFDPDTTALEVIETVARHRATWTETHIRAAVEDRVGVCVFDSDDDQRAAVEQVVALVRDRHSMCLSVDPDPVPAALQRSNGENQFDAPALTTVRYTSEAVLDAEARLQQAAHEPSPEFLTAAEVTAAIAAVEHARSTAQGTGHRLTVGQRRVVEHLCTVGTRLAVAVGPAGAGKTTALAAAVAAWRSTGRVVLALSPQKSAAQVLSTEIGIPADTIAALLWAHRQGTAAPIPRGAMILIDEAGMAATADLDAVQQLADAAGAVVRWVGDPWQLSAVEAGGALRLVCAETRAPELDTVVRFTDPDEAAASLHVRNGDPTEAWRFYSDHDRVQSGLTSELRAQMLAAHLHDLDDGVSSLMMAATLEDVFRLNGSAQAAYAERGVVDLTGASTCLSDGHRGYVGDIIVTRRNKGKLRILGGSRDGGPVTNGDRWQVMTVHQDGSLTVLGADHHGRVHLPAWYVTADVELGYSCTVHRAQGVTVDRAHLLMGTSLGRALAYVGLSRGRLWNGLYLSTDTLPDPPPLERTPDEPAMAAEVFASVCAREDDNISATEVMRSEQARIEDPQRLNAIYTRACQLLGRSRVERLLDRALPTVLYRLVRDTDGFDTLADTLTGAEHLGVSAGWLINRIVTDSGADEQGYSLLTARDAAAVLCARADRLLAGHLDSAASVRELDVDAAAPMPPRYPGIDIELADYAERLRIRLIGETPVRPDALLPLGDDVGFDTANDPDVSADRRARLIAEYDYYAHRLNLDHARHLLDRSMPTAVVHQVVSGDHWPQLLETIALAHSHGLEPGQLVADITRGDMVVLLSAHDAAALLCARADTWIAAHLGVAETAPADTEQPLVSVAAATPAAAFLSSGTIRFRALRDLPRPSGLCPMPPAHPGADTAAIDYADALRRALLELGAETGGAADTRSDATADAHRGSGEEVDPPTDPFFFSWDTIHFDDDSTKSAPAVEDVEDADSEQDDTWIHVEDSRTDQLYPGMDPIARVVRIHSDLLTAHARYIEARDAYREDRSEHQLAATPLIAHCRERVDALRPLVVAWRDAQQDYEEAHVQAAAAEDAYGQALRAQPEQADDQFLAWLQDKVNTSTSDPGVRTQLDAVLAEYRHAVADRAETEVDADIAQARLLAEDARNWAEQLRDRALTARQQLEDAAGADGVVEEADVHNMRLLADDLAMAAMVEAREQARRLPPYLNRARWEAAAVLQASRAITRAEAITEVDRIAGVSFAFFDEITAPVAPFPFDEPQPGTVEPSLDPHDEQSVDDEKVAAQMKADPIRLRSDADLDKIVRTLRQTNTHISPLFTPSVSRVEQIRDAHERLERQVTAITAAQRAIAAADADPDQASLRHLADLALDSAAAVGAPSHRWEVLLARAADTGALAAELAAAEHDDARDRQLREHAEAHAAHAANDLAAAMLEQRRRRTLSPADAAAEQRVRASAAPPVVAPPVTETGEPLPTTSEQVDMNLGL
ncbi:MobF family relaxase [Nocardia sp. 004]|uniref:MobF family relaxase n=1 Tax=Nocardia sp. 004 TaxID=3385978 RepID=UPI00399F2A68